MLRGWSAFHVLAKTFAEGPGGLRIPGLTGAPRALAVAELLQAHPRPALVLVESMTDAHHWTQDLKFFGAPALEFPGREPRLWRGGRQREADAERAVICRRLAAGEPVVVVVTPEALDAEIVAPGDFASRTLRLAKGGSPDPAPLLQAPERPGGPPRLGAGGGPDHGGCPRGAGRAPRGRAGEPASPRATRRAPAGRALARGRHVERTGGSPAGGRGGNARDARGSSLRRPVRTARGRDRAMAR